MDGLMQAPNTIASLKESVSNKSTNITNGGAKTFNILRSVSASKNSKSTGSPSDIDEVRC